MEEEIYDVLVSLASPYKKIDKDLIIPWIQVSMSLVCERTFGKDYNRAVALYTLHCLSRSGAFLQPNESVTGYTQRIQSFSLSGEFSQTFATVASSGTKEIKSTSWGLLYWSLKRKKGGGFGLITTGRGGCY